VTINDHTCAIIGGTGVGKSVLAQALINHQHTLLSSGLCVLDASNQVLSGYPQIHLWSDAIQLLSLKKPMQRIRPSLEKWAVSALDHFSNTASPLHSLYILETHNKSETALTPLQGISKFNMLRTHAYHQPLIADLIDLRQHQLRGTHKPLESKVC
jgi:ABC-type dipeptide/oligopeptide/nickel transport system ATPase component